jgi:hypothetical protein
MISYRNNDWQCLYLLTKDNAEIDLIIDRPGMPDALIEIKSTDSVKERDVMVLSRFLKDMPGCEGFCISRDIHEKKIHGVWCVYWERMYEVLGLE